MAAAGLLGLSPLFLSGPMAADGGPSTLPRREDVVYRLPGVGPLAVNTLSWQTKVGGLPAFSAYYDSVTPSAWQSGPVYSDLTWFWREDGLPGRIDFVGWADAARDTAFYTTPVQWLPLDPVSEGNWSTTATDTRGSTFTFAFSYDGIDSIVAGSSSTPDTFVCWRIVLRQTQVSGAVELLDGRVRDGLGVWRKTERAPGWTESDGAAAAAADFADTLWYEVNAIPRRRLAYRDDYPQNELLYLDHTTREDPVGNRSSSAGRFKAGWR